MKPLSVPLISLLVFVAAVGAVPLAAADPADQSAETAVQTDDRGAEFPVTLTDATGTEVTIDERPERVVTTNPSAAQVMWGLNAESQVVGLTQFAHYLDGAESRTNISSTEQGVSIERVVGADPELVLAPNTISAETVEQLRETGLTVYHFPQVTDFDDVMQKTLTIGQLTGNIQAAHETNTWVAANVESVSAATAETEPPRLLYPLLGGFAVGGETFIHEIIAASGAENVASGEFDGYEVLNDEVVLTLDPEVLLVTDQTAGQIMNTEPYSLTTAGENNRSVTLEVNYINQAGPRSIVYSMRNLTAQLHPGQYDESDHITRQAVADGEYTPANSEDSTERDDGNDARIDRDTETAIPVFGFAVVLAAIVFIGGGLMLRRR